MNIQSRTLVGHLDIINRNAIDCSINGFIAYGCQSTIAIADPESIQIIQTLDNRKGIISKVKWSNTRNKIDSLSREIKLKLASGDDLGSVTIWDVSEGLVLYEFNEALNIINTQTNNSNSGNNNNLRPMIQDMKWLNYLDNFNNDDYLLVLNTLNTITLYNCDSGTKVWSKTFAETIVQITLDPYSSKRVAFLSPNCIQFVEDFSFQQAPLNIPRKFHITNTSSISNTNKTQSDDASKRGGASSSGIFNAGYWLRTLVENTTISDTNRQTKQDDTSSSVSLNDCLQIEFSCINKNLMYVLYPKEMFIFDLVINQTVGYIQLERTNSLFMQIYMCAQRDVIYFLHENGSISVRTRVQDSVYELNEHKVQNNLNFFDNLNPHDFTYETRAQSDAIRITKSTKPYNFSVSIINEKNVSLLLSDGRLLMYELLKQSSLNEQQQNDQSKPVESYGYFNKTQRQYLKDLLYSSYESSSKINFKLYLTSVLNNLPQLPFCMKICPPMTRKNWSYYESLLAIGCSNGDLYIYQLENGVLWRKYTLHTYPIRGIEWITLKSCLTWSNTGQTNISSIINSSSNNANSSSNSSNNNENSMNASSMITSATMDLNSLNTGGKQLVKNDILYTDLITGETKHIRQDITNEESPIVSIKTSYLKQYFIIIFKEQPLEIWDLKTFTIIRKLSNKSPVITILEWSPSFTKKAVTNQPTSDDIKRKFSLYSQSDDQSSIGEDLTLTASTTKSLNISDMQDSSNVNQAHNNQHVSIKENFICIDNNGLMYSFYVEGHTIKDGSKVLLEDGSLSNIISLALKNDYIVFGDEYGNLSIWELKNKISKTIHTKRGAIRKLKFAPGKENLRLLILYSFNAIEVFDLNKQETISFLKIKEKFYDADWCTCDKPIILMSDGCIRIVDINLKQLPNQLSYIQYSMNLFNYKALNNNFINKKFTIKEYIALKYLLYDSFKTNINYEQVLNKKLNEYFLNEKNLQQNLNDILLNLNKNLILLLNSNEAIDKCLISEIESLNNIDNNMEIFGNLIKALNLAVKYETLTSQIYSNYNFECKFWSIFKNYLKNLILINYESVLQKIMSSCTGISNIIKLVSNESDNDFVFYDVKLYRLNELKYLKLYEQKRITYQQNKNLINDLLLSNQLDKVFNLLLETESTNVNYLNDYLKACLVYSLKLNEFVKPSNDNANNSDIIISNLKSSIKLIATNLIANGKLADGIQLLCLNGLVYDACRYLQDNSQWDKAIWLAKMRLNDEDLVEVIKRWSDYLCSSQINKKNYAILLLLSCGQFSKIIEIMLNYREYTHLAMLFTDVCLTCGLLQVKEDESVQKQDNAAAGDQQQKNSQNLTSKSLISVLMSQNSILKSKCDKVFANNAKLIYKLDNMSMFKELCSRAGTLGEELLSN